MIVGWCGGGGGICGGVVDVDDGGVDVAAGVYVDGVVVGVVNNKYDNGIGSGNDIVNTTDNETTTIMEPITKVVIT